MGEAKRRGTKEQRVAALLDESGVASMTPERYNAFVAWTRTPTANLVGEELEFFSNTAETLIGVLIKDRTGLSEFLCSRLHRELADSDEPTPHVTRQAV